MHAGLLSLWLTGTCYLLFPQCFAGDPDDSEYEDVTSTAGYSTYTEYIDYNDYDYDNTTAIDYYLYATPMKGTDQEQSKSIKDGALNGGMSHINDKTSAMFRYYALGLGLTVQQFYQ